MNPSPPAQRSGWVDWVVFAALGLMWGSSYLWIKIGVGALEPWTLIALRLAIGATVLGAVVALAREPLPREPRIYGHLGVMSVTNIAVPFYLITTAEQSVESALAAIINGAVPLFVIVIAALALNDEPITVNRLIGLAIGFVGVVVLVSRGLAGGVTSSLYGEVALVVSTVSYAASAVYARRYLRGLRPMIPAFFQVAFALLIAAAFALLVERPFATIVTPEAVASVVWLGMLGSGIAYLAFYRLIRNWGATRTSLVAYLLPVVGIALGVVVLKEQVDARILVGTALVIGGVALVNSRFGQRRLFGRAPVETA